MNNHVIVSFLVALFLLPFLLHQSTWTCHQENRTGQLHYDAGPPQPKAGISDYHTYDEMKAELFQIQTDHPNIVRLTTTGKTFENRDLWAVKISDNPLVDEEEPEVVIYGMHHAREWLSAEVPMYLINFLTDNYETNVTVQHLVDERETWIIPMVNPDGRTFDGEDDPSSYQNWRKNRVVNNDGSRGVDPNRNYGYMWGGAGASDRPQSDIYRGGNAFSENESRALRDLALQHDFVFSLSYHSFGQLILYPWGNTLNPSSDDFLFERIAEGMSDRMTNKAQSPRDRYIPIRGSQLYLTSGDDLDWMYGEMGILSFVVELYPTFSDSTPAVSSPFNGFHPREDKIQPVCEDNLGGALYLLEIADNPYQVIPHVSLNARPSVLTINRGQNLSFQIEVWNDGNQPDTYSLHERGSPGWKVSFSESTLSVVRGEKRVVDMWVDIPAFSPSGDFDLEISAVSSSTSANISVTVHVPYLNDVGVSGILPFQQGEVYPMGNYTIQAEVTNHGLNQQSNFAVAMEIWELGPLEERTILSQGFESGISGWEIVDYDGSVSQDSWHTVSSVAHSGNSSVWVGDDSTSEYSDKTLQMLVSPPFSLKEARGANLSFYHILSTEVTYDYAVVEIGIKGDWEVLHSWSGWIALSFSRVEFDLSKYLGKNEVRVRFRFSSDEHKVDLGWYLDDIEVSATLPREQLIHGPVNVRITSQLSREDSENVSWRYKSKRGGDFRIVVFSLLLSDENLSNDFTKVSFSVDPNRYRIFLSQGLNLVSYPLIVSNDSSESVLSSIQGMYDSIQKYIGDSQWQSWSSSKNWQGPIRLNLSEGWWIHVLEETYLDVTGVLPGRVNIHLSPGWNLVGYPTLTDRTVAEALFGVNYTKVETFDEESPYHLRTLRSDDYLTTGMGYWIYLTEESVWSIYP